MAEIAPAVVATVSSIASAGMAASQAQRQAQQQMAANNAALAQQYKQASLAHRIEERRRKRTLAAQRATARATAGARGISTPTGSSSALLAGLTRESARQGNETADQRVLGLQGSLLNVENRNRAALLDAAAARERVALSAATGAGKLVGAQLKYEHDQKNSSRAR